MQVLTTFAILQTGTTTVAQSNYHKQIRFVDNHTMVSSYNHDSTQTSKRLEYKANKRIGILSLTRFK